MLCPRCVLATLQENDYEGQRVALCSNCWGAWMTLDQLDAIVASTSSRFSRAERRTTQDVVEREGDVDRTGSEHTEARCPECSSAMGRRTYVEGCPIVLDVCPRHGVWLDAGELKELQVLHE